MCVGQMDEKNQVLALRNSIRSPANGQYKIPKESKWTFASFGGKFAAGQGLV
jgi:hypothetical protein